MTGRHKILLGIVLSQISLIDASCCSIKIVPGSDPRSGKYLYNSTNFDLPSYCNDQCAYQKEGDTSDDLYCFGSGDLSSQCSGDFIGDNKTFNDGPDLEQRLREIDDDDELQLGYYESNYAGNNTENVTCGDIFRLTDEMVTSLFTVTSGSAVAVSDTAWSNSEIVLRRLDGESSGSVAYNHLVGIFAKSTDDGRWYRLKITSGADTTTNDVNTRFKVVSADGTDCTGNVEYEKKMRIVTEDGSKMIDIGKPEKVSWIESGQNTRFHLELVV